MFSDFISMISQKFEITELLTKSFFTKSNWLIDQFKARFRRFENSPCGGSNSSNRLSFASPGLIFGKNPFIDRSNGSGR